MSIDRLSGKNLKESLKLWDGLISNTVFADSIDYSLKNRISWVNSNLNFRCKRVLNVGSGQAYLEKTLKQKTISASLFVSLDISRSALIRAKPHNNNLVLGFIEALPFASSSFDAVVCMEVIEHLTKKQVKHALSELKRIIKPGGELLISVPIYEQSPLKSHVVGHMRKFVPEEIRSEVIDVGLDVRRTHELYSFPKFNSLFSWVARTYSVRRPSVRILYCRKP